MSDSFQFHGLQQDRLLYPPVSPGISSNLCPLSQWFYLTFSSSAAHFSFSLQFFPASGLFPESQFFTSGCQSIGASAWAIVLPMNSQGWFPLGLIDLISLLSKRFSRIFSISQFSSVQSLSYGRLFTIPWIAARQASLSITNSWSLLKLMSIESVMLSRHLILCCPLYLSALPQWSCVSLYTNSLSLSLHICKTDILS